MSGYEMASASRWRAMAALLAAIVALGALALVVWPDRVSHWEWSITTSGAGPLQLQVEMREGLFGGLRLRSSSGARDMLEVLPGAQAPVVSLSDGSWAWKLSCDDSGLCEGESLASRAGDPMRLRRIDPDHIEGRIEKGWFRGDFAAVRVDGAIAGPLRDYSQVVSRLRAALRDHLFDPGLLDDASVRSYLTHLEEVARRATDDADFLLATRWSWDGPPRFSHFELRRSERDADALARHFDVMDVGEGQVDLTINDKVAVLKVATMMGRDTRANIERAMREVISRECAALILDLRGNAGGDLAIVPLLQSTLESPFSGLFVSAQAGLPAGQAPGPDALSGLEPWRGDSLLDFWQQVQGQAMTHIRFDPWADAYSGDLVVLVDGNTASAAEIVAGALQESGRAKLLGEPTAGRVLSSAYFDLGDGFQAVIPVADYYANGRTRYEGRPLQPDIEAASADALLRAHSMLRGGSVAAAVTGDPPAVLRD